MEDIENVELMVARGKYTTLRVERERLQKLLSNAADNLQKSINSVNRFAANEYVELTPSENVMRCYVEMLSLAGSIRAIDAQRAELKDIAWPR